MHDNGHMMANLQTQDVMTWILIVIGIITIMLLTYLAVNIPNKSRKKDAIVKDLINRQKKFDIDLEDIKKVNKDTLDRIETLAQNAALSMDGSSAAFMDVLDKLDTFESKIDKEIEINAANESTLINAMAKLDKNTEDISDIRERMPKKKPAVKPATSKTATKSSTSKKKES